MRTPEQILASLISDVDAMRVDAPESVEVFSECDHWLGHFQVYETDHRGALIQWPNLSILIREAREALKE